MRGRRAGALVFAVAVAVVLAGCDSGKQPAGSTPETAASGGSSLAAGTD